MPTGKRAVIKERTKEHQTAWEVYKAAIGALATAKGKPGEEWAARGKLHDASNNLDRVKK